MSSLQTLVRKGPKKKYGHPTTSDERDGASKRTLSVQLRGKSEIECIPLDPTRPVRESFLITEIEGCLIRLVCNIESKKEVILGQMKNVLTSVSVILFFFGFPILTRTLILTAW